MKEMICIECPRGCHLKIDDKLNVTGNHCIRGKNYAINELSCPKRIVTSTVYIHSKIIRRLPVMTESEVAKEKVFDVIKELNKIKISAPIQCRDVIIENVCNTNVNVIATRTIEK